MQKKPINYAPKVTFEFLDFLANGNCTSKVHKNRKNWARDLYEVAMTSYRSLVFLKKHLRMTEITRRGIKSVFI
jgi:hypothetical protein